MNLFNIGTGEFFLLLVMALVVFGPERLPEVARKAGKAIRDVRGMVSNLDPELLQDWREITQDVDSVREEVKSMRSDLVGIQKDLSMAAKDISSSLDGAAKDATKTVNEVIHEKTGSRPGATSTAKAATSTASTAKAGTSGSSAGTAPATAARAKGTTGIASAATPAVPARPAVATMAKPVVPTPSYKKSGVADSTDEIIGTPLSLGEDGDWHVITEVVGQKVYPVWRKAPKAANTGNGRHAAAVALPKPTRMARLAEPRTAERPARLPTRTARPNPPSRSLAVARPGRAKRG